MGARLVYIQTSVNAYVSGEDLIFLLDNQSIILHVQLGREAFADCFATLNLNGNALDLFRAMYLAEYQAKEEIRQSRPAASGKGPGRKVR